MLRRLKPNEIGTCWSWIKRTLDLAMPPFIERSEDRDNRVLRSALAGELHVWLAYEDADQKNELRPAGCVLTTFNVDPVSATKNLEIIAAASLRSGVLVSEKLWRSGMAEIAQFAVDSGCYRMIAVTQDPRIIEIAGMLGGETLWSFVSFDLKAEV